MKSWQKMVIIAFIVNEVLLLGMLLWMLVSEILPVWVMMGIHLGVILSILLGSVALFVKGDRS